MRMVWESSTRMRWLWMLTMMGPRAAADDAAPLAEFPDQNLDWSACHEADLDQWREEELAEAREFAPAGPELEEYRETVERDHQWRQELECAQIRVPVDYSDPGGATTPVAIGRHPATGQAEERIGALMVNPGGPGVSGVEFLDYALFAEEVAERFDVVGFDPRGVGGSRELWCDIGEEAIAEDLLTATEADLADPDDELEQALADSAETFATDCAERVGEGLMSSLSGDVVAHDLDVLRAALGEEEFNFVGFSYGTYLGAHYAEEYGDRVRAIVLDGGVETTLSNPELAREQAQGFQASWEAFADYCAEQPNCPLRGAETATEDTAEVLDRIEAADLQILGEDLDRATALTLLSDLLYHEWDWEFLYWTLEGVEYGDMDYVAENLEWMAEPWAHTDAEGEEVWTDGPAARLLIECADREDPTDLADYRDIAAAAHEESPLFGAAMVWSTLPCAYLPTVDHPDMTLTASDAPWLQADHEGLTGKVLKWPERGEIDTPVQESLIVELYSK
jgi:pimeloyl-ACP methyl ester carboxylesterase